MDIETKEYIDNLEKFENNWEELKEFLKEYKKEKTGKNGDYASYGRYCIALSIDDILKKMEEIESNN